MNGKATCIVGAGGLGKCVLHVARVTRSRVVALDDKVTGKNIVGSLHFLKDKKFLREHKFVVAIGSNSARHMIYDQIIKDGGELDRLVHPYCAVSPDQVGLGTMILPGAIIGPEATVGQLCVIGNSVSIAHDCIIGHCANICDGTVLGGHVDVGEDVFIGLNATVLPKIRIGKGAVIGAGAVVVEDVADGAVVYGNPARANVTHSPAISSKPEGDRPLSGPSPDLGSGDKQRSLRS